MTIVPKFIKPHKVFVVDLDKKLKTDAETKTKWYLSVDSRNMLHWEHIGIIKEPWTGDLSLVPYAVRDNVSDVKAVDEDSILKKFEDVLWANN